MFNDLLVLLALLIILFLLYQKLRQIWLRRLFSQKKNAKQPRIPPVLHPKSERDCRFCQEDKRKNKEAEREVPVAWQQKKGKGGPKKKVHTEGYFCPNERCEYYGIGDEETHALVGYGCYGRHENIRDFKCQACGKKFTTRRNTVLYRLKSLSGLVEKILWLLALGVDASALEEVFGVREVTIRIWLCRSGDAGQEIARSIHARIGPCPSITGPSFSTSRSSALSSGYRSNLHPTYSMSLTLPVGLGLITPGSLVCFPKPRIIKRKMAHQAPF